MFHGVYEEKIMKSLRYEEGEQAWLPTFIIVHVTKGTVIIIYILMTGSSS